MSELLKIVITAFFTLLIGILIFVSQRLFLYLFIEPIHKQREVLGETIDKMIYHDHFFANPGTSNIKKRKVASNELRRCATNLSAKTHLIPWYSLFSFFHIVIAKKDVTTICKNLIGLSNGIFNITPSIQASASQNIKWQREIEKILKIEHV